MLRRIAAVLFVSSAAVAWGQDVPPAPSPETAAPVAVDAPASPEPMSTPAPEPTPAALPERALVQIPPADLQAAIAQGQKNRGRRMGLRLVDQGRGIMNALTAMGSRPGSAPTSGTGFSLQVYTPIAWIMQMSSDAAKRYETFGPDNVTTDMLEPVLRVVVYPDMPTVVTARGMSRTSSVDHVVLRDASKKKVVQPMSEEPFEEEAANAMGGRAMYYGVRATFALDDLATLRGPAGTGEFHVTVVGDRDEKDFKVKTKHFDDLPGLPGAPPQKR